MRPVRSRLRRHRSDVGQTEAASPPKDPAEERLARLEKAFDDLRGSGAAAPRVMQLVDDPDSTVQDVAAAIDLDPIFTAQVLRLANSAGFGLSTTISTTSRAVGVIGFTTLRSLAAILATDPAAAGRSAPTGFWEHSAATAAGCVAVSTRFGVQRDEAFSMGLLHDLGWLLLDAVDPERHRSLVPGVDDTPVHCDLESAYFGISHPEAAARLLELWNFPPRLVQAIRFHHHAPTAADSEQHRRVLYFGDALAHHVLGSAGFGFEASDLTEFGFSAAALTDLAALTDELTRDIVASFTP